MKFIHVVGMMYELSKSPQGLTAGAMVKRLGGAYSRAQVERQLKKLVGEGALHIESSPHRANISKNVYHIKGDIVNDLGAVVDCYDSTPHTKSMLIYDNAAL